MAGCGFLASGGGDGSLGGLASGVELCALKVEVCGAKAELCGAGVEGCGSMAFKTRASSSTRGFMGFFLELLTLAD